MPIFLRAFQDYRTASTRVSTTPGSSLRNDTGHFRDASAPRPFSHRRSVLFRQRLTSGGGTKRLLVYFGACRPHFRKVDGDAVDLASELVVTIRVVFRNRRALVHT